MKILVLGAHPDDETVGMAGTIAKHTRAGDEVFVAIMGERTLDREFNEAFVKDIAECALKAHKLLGVKDTFFGKLRDQRLGEPLIELIRAVEEFVWMVEPDTVYVTHRGDVNQDHQSLFKATMVATRAISKHLVPTVLCYEAISSTEQAPPFIEYDFSPNYFVNIAETLDLKLAAMKLYHSELKEFPHPRSPEGIKISAQRWGMKVGCQAAEAFELVRHIEG